MYYVRYIIVYRVFHICILILNPRPGTGIYSANDGGGNALELFSFGARNAGYISTYICMNPVCNV